MLEKGGSTDPTEAAKPPDREEYRDQQRSLRE
jgi:hypothetical protein